MVQVSCYSTLQIRRLTLYARSVWNLNSNPDLVACSIARGLYTSSNGACCTGGTNSPKVGFFCTSAPGWRHRNSLTTYSCSASPITTAHPKIVPIDATRSRDSAMVSSAYSRTFFPIDLVGVFFFWSSMAVEVRPQSRLS